MAGSDSSNQSLFFLTENPSVSAALSWTAVLKSCHCVPWVRVRWVLQPFR